MIHEAQVNLAGYVAADPKFKKVAGDISSTKLRVAYTARRRDRDTGEWSDGPTSFVNVQCWRTLAENVQMSVHKGEPVLVTGRLQIRRYEVEGAPRTAVEIEAMSIGHDLTRGVAQFSRTRWPSAIAAAAAEMQAAAAEMQAAAAEAGDGTEPADGPGAGERPGQGAGGPDGNGLIDESAVAEFARELSGSLGPDAAADPAGDPTADAGASLPA